MSFIIYDLIFLGVFTLGVVIFLYTRKHNLQRQGILYLYRTKLGIKFIDRFAKRFEKILKPMQYVVVATGFILMISIIWLLLKSIYYYFTLFPTIFSQTKSPPLVLLLPYTPKIFGLESFLPPLYFTTFIIMFMIIAVPHEFAHGIFARLNKFKIHATGFAFLGPILGAFVEPDEKQMEKAKKFPHMAILAAGTFANVLTVIFFGIVFWLFFTGLFIPSGVKFNTYAVDVVEVPGISVIGESSIEGFTEIEVDGVKYFAKSGSLDEFQENEIPEMYVYSDSPAFRAQLRGAITEIDGMKTRNYDEMVSALRAHEPGDIVVVKTAILENGRDAESSMQEYEIELGARNGVAFLGIGQLPFQRDGVMGFIYATTFAKIKDPMIYYESELGEFGWFTYYLLWWILFASAMVALINMLPLGIFDGGRFFYLAVWGLTGSEKVGKRAFSISTWLILLLLLMMMVRWAFGFI